MIDRDKAKQLAKQHAPTAIVGVIAIAALARGLGGSAGEAVSPSSLPSVSLDRDEFKVRSCGKQSTLTGDWRRGVVEIDPTWGRDTCTIALSHVVSICSAQHGTTPLTLSKSSDSRRIVVEKIHGGDRFTYACE